MRNIAAIFDMDGTLIDNNPYHFKSWQVLFRRHGKPELSKETFNKEMSGVPAMVTLRKYFGNEYDEDGLKQLFKEKDEIYHHEYAPHIKPINGLEHFLKQLKANGIKTAVASSASTVNVEFAFSRLSIRPYFDAMIDATGITKPKPEPQIFLKAAEALRIEPVDCVVFEDSVSGVKAANAAGMKVVAITTTHKAGELKPVDMAIADYTQITVTQLLQLFEDNHERKHQ